MKHFGSLLVLAAVLAVSTSVGCYTMLRHPEAEVASMDDGADQACLECHAEAEYSLWVDPYAMSYYYPTRWQLYYSHPWWWDRYDYYPPSGAIGPSVETGGRHVWDRGPGQPYIPGVGGGRIATPSPPSTQPTVQDTSRSTPPSQGDQREKKKRNVWGR